MRTHMPIAFEPTTLEHLLAIEKIRLLVLSYSYCIDGGRGDLVELFTEDAVWDSSDDGRPRIVGREEIAAFFGDEATRALRRQRHGGNRLNHVVLSPLITEMSEDEARGICTYAGQ